MSSPSRTDTPESEAQRVLVFIGQYPTDPLWSRKSIEDRCAALHHPKSSCEASHTGGTHSLGPLWGTESKHTDKREQARAYGAVKKSSEKA